MKAGFLDRINKINKISMGGDAGGLRKIRGAGLRVIDQGSVFDEAAELLFGDVMVGAFASEQVAHGFILHFEAMEFDNAQEFIPCFPDLALLQFHSEAR